MGKTKAQILEEKQIEADIHQSSQRIVLEQLQCLSSVLQTHVSDGTEFVYSAFNQKGIDVITAKIIELVKKIE